MGQRSNDAAVKDALIKSSKEECAGDMGQIVIHMTNLPHSDFRMDQHMTKQLQRSPIDMLLQLQLQVVKIMHVAILLR